MRLDQYLLGKGYFDSRAKAKEAISMAKVFVDGKICRKAAFKIFDEMKITVQGNAVNYVSRSAKKLSAALKHFDLDVKNSVCLDIGSSTGGFTQVLLASGAKEIYAVDVGKNQMHESVAKDERVHLFEDTDIRDFELPERVKVDLLVADVSFVSLRKISGLFKNFVHKNSSLLLLFKPQFEVGRANLKKGIYKNVNVEEVLNEFIVFLESEGFKNPMTFKVPLKGKKGNQEYFVYSRSGTIIK